MVGELNIIASRDRAWAAPGDRFDLRRLPTIALDTGSAPLDELEQWVDEWIASANADSGVTSARPSAMFAFHAVVGVPAGAAADMT
jgi:hypothetical protein